MIQSSPTLESPNPIPQSSQESKAQIKGRFFGIAFFFTQLGCMIAHGISGSFFQDEFSTDTTLAENISIALLGLFLMIGYGLVLSFYRYGSWLGMSTALIILAVCFIICPLFQKLAWVIVFGRSDIEILESTNSPNIIKFWNNYNGDLIQSSLLYTRTTFISCISLLTMMTAIIGRVGVLQTLRITIVFQIGWNLNYVLLIYLCIVGSDSQYDQLSDKPFIFDTFGSSYVYLYACSFGILTSWKACKKFSRIHSRNQSNGLSLTLCSIGTGFIFACFVFSSSNFIEFTSVGQNISRFNILFSLIGSISGTYVSSTLFSKEHKVGYKQALIGTISGGVAIGFGAPILDNIGLAIGLGFATGFLSGIYMIFVHPKINRNSIYDTLGLFGPFLISSLIGSLVVAPSVLAYNFNKDQLNLSIGQSFPKTLITWQLIYAGISFGMGLGASLINWLFSICDIDEFGMASNQKFFENDFGLYQEQRGIVREQRNGKKRKKRINKGNVDVVNIQQNNQSQNILRLAQL